MDEPRPLGEGVDHVLAELGAPSADTIAAVVGEWAGLVGETLAARTEPRSIEHGRLLVHTRDPAVAEQLRWSERRILDRLDDLVGGGVVDRVEVRVRP
jgi:hypothetical protein